MSKLRRLEVPLGEMSGRKSVAERLGITLDGPQRAARRRHNNHRPDEHGRWVRWDGPHYTEFACIDDTGNWHRANPHKVFACAEAKLSISEPGSGMVW